MGIRILVVEDDPSIADSLVRGLREEGFTVEHVADGEVAHIVLESREWDLVLLDWWLPGRGRSGGPATLAAAPIARRRFCS